MAVKVYCDGSGKQAVFKIEGREPVVTPNVEGMTHNDSEYFAIILALRYIEENLCPSRKYEIVSDSRLAINQINGDWKVRNKRMERHTTTVHKLCWNAGTRPLRVTFVWVPRAELPIDASKA